MSPILKIGLEAVSIDRRQKPRRILVRRADISAESSIYLSLSAMEGPSLVAENELYYVSSVERNNQLQEHEVIYAIPSSSPSSFYSPWNSRIRFVHLPFL